MIADASAGFPPALREWRRQHCEVWEAFRRSGRPLPPSATDALGPVWGADRAAFDAARRLTQSRPNSPRSTAAADPTADCFPFWDAVNDTADLLAVDAVAAVRAGDPDRAVDDVTAVLAIARYVGADELWAAHAGRLTARGLACRLAADALAADRPVSRLADLQTVLQAAAAEPVLPPALKAQRAAFDREFTAAANPVVFNNLMRLHGMTPPNGLADLARYRLMLADDHDAALRWHTDLVRVADRPPHEWPADKPAPPDDWRHLLSRRAALEGNRTVQRTRMDQAVVRSVVLAVACERFRQGQGRWPADHSELKELLPAVPADPYDSQPLRYRRLDDGVVVYAVGPDRQDDGGALSYGNPQPGEDVGFRLWDVAARRQPAEPKPGD
jgi:hypothetical protein